MTFRSSFIITAFLLSGLTARFAYAQSSSKEHSSNGESRKVPVNQPSKHAATDTVGVVNGEIITYGDFRSIMAGYLKAFVARSGDNVVSDSLYTVIVDSSWDRALTDIITEAEIAKRHVAMTNSEIEEVLAQNPPDYLRKQFTDSSGKFHGDIMQKALADPRNDSIANIVLSDERVSMESERLIDSFGAKNASPAEHQKAFDAWLRHAKTKVRISDYRIRFGFY